MHNPVDSNHFVTSCGGGNKITGDSKETQIKKSFAKTLEMYPIKNLEDLYDKEGYRDGEFKRATKVHGQYQQILLKATNKVK